MRLFHAIALGAVVCLAFSQNAEAEPARALEKVKVLVPERENLDYMSFWVAKSAGYFLDEGLEVELVVPSSPEQSATLFAQHEADVAVLPPPIYVSLIARKSPVVLVANLFTIDAGAPGERADHRRIHALAVTRTMLETRHERVVSMVRAIALAESLIHRMPADAAVALAREIPGRNRGELETFVRVHDASVPKTPVVRADDISSALSMLPSDKPKPDLSGIDLERHVAPDLLAARPPQTARIWAIVIGVAFVVVAALVAFTTKRRVPATSLPPTKS